MVGCGGMGLRHAYGYIEARRLFESLDLAAVCDLHETAANKVADEVERATGRRPKVYTDFRRMLDQERGLDAVEVVTETRMHHAFSVQALQAGKHVMTEKPMGLTLLACRLMAEAARKSGKTLAVAENFRRDPLNRLGKALIEAGAIGRPLFALDIAVSGGSDGVMHGTAWRARKDRAGGIVMDAGVHNADLLLYYMGDVDVVYAETGVMRPVRQRLSMSRMNPNLAAFYAHREAAEGTEHRQLEQDAVDTAFALVKFKSGAIGQFTMTDSAPGYRLAAETVHGSEGTLVRSPSRSGKGPEIRRPDGAVLKGDNLLGLVPGWRLDAKTAALWRGDRLASYDLPWEQIDRKIIAIEYQDFVEAIEGRRPPEVGPLEGMQALALLYAVLESGHARAPVKFDDVISGSVSEYQKEIDAAAGI
jgi:predicted dehydrogenase